jgi:hypothetical protein
MKTFQRVTAHPSKKNSNLHLNLQAMLQMHFTAKIAAIVGRRDLADA